ncbi:MAG: signal peptidase I [Bacilli bacterium]
MKLLKEIFPYVIIVMVVVLIRMFIITPVRVDGLSMVPTLKNGEILLLKKYDKKIKRFDIVVVDYQNTKLVKRVIGLPGEHIKYMNNKLYINNKIVSENFINTTTSDYDLKELKFDFIPNNYYFVVGDNRNNSKDSRIIGLIHIDKIIGTTDFSLFPFDKFGKIK